MLLSTSRRWFLPIGLLLAVVAAGCASTASLSRFDAFAKVGQQYVQAVDALLVKAGEIKVDTSSEGLLADRDLAPVSRSVFLERDKADRGYLDELSLLRRQVDLLGDYFAALDALAASNAPQAFGSTLASTAGSLDTLSQELRGKGLAQSTQAAQALASGVGSLVVKRAESRALQRELEQRGETIAQVLLLQEALLGAIRDQTASSLSVTRNRQYQEQVVNPYEDASTPLDATSWKQARYQGISPPDPVEQLTAAESAARSLRAAWTKLLGRQLGPDDINAVASDLEPILAALNAL
jgi:hypothetical protein